MKRVFTILSLLIISATLWFANYRFPNEYLNKTFITLIFITIIYLFFKIFIDHLTRKIKDLKSRYSVQKLFSIIFIAFLVIAIISIWIENTQSLMVSYGLLAAGVAIALQDIFKNFMGGIMIYINRIFKVGDRIEINNICGDVIDIDILYTKLMEIKSWVAGDQATGRITTIPNGVVLATSIFNYTKDHDFIWDEMRIPITYKSNWKKAMKIIYNIVEKKTSEISKQADKQINKLGQKYYLHKRSTKPDIFLTLTDNWIMFNIRYCTSVRERRIVNNELSTIILEKLSKCKDITIASTTMEIVGFPEIKLKRKTTKK